EVTWGPSMWGHDRLWMTPEKRAEARAIRVEAAASGLRKPVNVIEGNYKLAPGVCPWWDGVGRGEAAEKAGVKPRASRIRNHPACCRCRRAAARSSSRTCRARRPGASGSG